jgi:PAS domain S-box-containing protein
MADKVAQFRPRLAGDERYRLLVESIRDYAIFMLDPQGRVTTWNEGARRLKGYEAEEIVGRHFSTFYPPEVAARGWPEHELEVAAREGRFEDEGWRLRKDGTRFWANVVITALRDQSGQLVGFAKVTRDLSERRRHEEELRRSEERFRLMVEVVQDYAIFMLDGQGRVASWNAGAQRIKGYSAEEIIGRHFSAFYPPEVAASGWPDRELESARKEGRFEDEGWRLRKDGTRFWANVVITAIHDDAGQFVGFVKVTRDMTQRRRVEALEEAERQMNEFLAMLAHELRNPLAPIRNALSVLQMTAPAQGKEAWARNIIDRQLTHMTRLVDDLLDVSRITSGKITLHREPIDLRDAIATAVEASRPLIDARHHRLEVTVPPEPLRMSADATRLAQVVVNLLNNAAKYTPEGGHIRLSLDSNGSQAIVRVRDNGMGITPELLPHVFDLFMQGQRSLDRSEGGLGIGLTLVHRLAHMHGGSVEAHSAGTGRGSEFVVRLPLAGADAPADPGPDRSKPAPAPGRRVLVVDDNADSAESMCLLLGMWGHEARVARSPQDALAVAAEFRPELVLLDIGLPGMDGYELAGRLREMPGGNAAMMVAVTGYGHEDDRRRSERAGFSAHLVKPVAVPNLQRVLASLPPAGPADTAG